MEDRPSVMVRLLARHEVEAVTRSLPGTPSSKHHERLAQQEQGSAVYLIAWRGEQPAGHVFVRLRGTADERLLARTGPCAYLQDLYVVPRWRSQGIGTCLLLAAEDETRARGGACLALSVAANNLRARALYAHLGYIDSGLGEHPTSGTYAAANGQRREWFDTSYYLVKEIGDEAEGAGIGNGGVA